MIQIIGFVVLGLVFCKAVIAPSNQGKAHVYSASDTVSAFLEFVITGLVCGRVMEWW